MAEEIAFENGRITNFERLVTLTLTLDRIILHTVVHHSSTCTYMPNFVKIEETFCGRTDECTDGHLRPALLGRLCRKVNLKMQRQSSIVAALLHRTGDRETKLLSSPVPLPAGKRGRRFAGGVSQRSVVFAASILLILVTEV